MHCVMPDVVEHDKKHDDEAEVQPSENLTTLSPWDPTDCPPDCGGLSAFTGAEWLVFRELFEAKALAESWSPHMKAERLFFATHRNGLHSDAVECASEWSYDQLIRYLDRRHKHTKTYAQALTQVCRKYRREDTTNEHWRRQVLSVVAGAPLSPDQHKLVIYHGFVLGLRFFPRLQAYVLVHEEEPIMDQAVKMVRVYEGQWGKPVFKADAHPPWGPPIDDEPVLMHSPALNPKNVDLLKTKKKGWPSKKQKHAATFKAYAIGRSLAMRERGAGRGTLVSPVPARGKTQSRRFRCKRSEQPELENECHPNGDQSNHSMFTDYEEEWSDQYYGVDYPAPPQPTWRPLPPKHQPPPFYPLHRQQTGQPIRRTTTGQPMRRYATPL